MNLKEYIQEVRLRHARLMLNTTRLPIQEIASNCGFLDVNYFTRVFRKVHGISPRAYRNKMHNIQED
jgi:AraC-like DNA-binding protein